MVGMATDKKSDGKGKRGRPPTGRTATYNIHTNIDPELGADLEAYMLHFTYEPKLKAVVERAIRLLLEADGWPMKSKPST